MPGSAASCLLKGNGTHHNRQASETAPGTCAHDTQSPIPTPAGQHLPHSSQEQNETRETDQGAPAFWTTVPVP